MALDPHRAGHERAYYPGEANFLRADVLVINKVNTADPKAPSTPWSRPRPSTTPARAWC